jgi:acetolactate synthase-1/2/3 large subunit
MERTGAQIIWECLAHEGVRTVFGYPGGAILPAYDAMLDFPIRHVLVRHEQGASHMADGYARASGEVGVCMATSGPGATNLVTGIATAQMDSSPMVCITGQVPSKLIGYDAFQETDICGITLPITKHNYLVTRVQDIMPAMKEAFHLAKSGRPGPVLVDITKDAQQAVMQWDWDERAVKMRGYRPIGVAKKSELERAADLIRSARKPSRCSGWAVFRRATRSTSA